MGFASGFQVGSQAVERALKRREEEQLKQQLGQESERYGVTEGAYGPGLQENIQQLQGLREKDPTQAPAYDQAIGELQRRQGLTSPDYSVGSRATNYGTREEAQRAAAPMRTEGLAGVYRQAGDVVKADELETRAFDQQRAIAAEERAKTAEGRAAQEFATRQTETGLRINQLARTEAEQQNFTGFSTFAAENPNLSVKELKETAFKQFKFTPKQWQDTVTTRLGIENAEMDSFKNSVKKKLQGKNLNQVGELYNSDPDFDDKTDLAMVPGKDGAVTLNFINKDSKTVTESQTFKSQALALEYLNKQATEPETIGSWMMNLQKAEVGLDKDRAAINASRASAAKDTALGGLYAAGGKDTSVASLVKEAQKLVDNGSYKDLPTAIEGLKRGSVKPEFNPKDYTASIKNLMDTGMSLPAATAQADQLYGRGPSVDNENARLQKDNEAKAAPQPTQLSMQAPAVRPGLVSPAQLAAGQQAQSAQSVAASQQNTSEGIRASGLAREAFVRRQEAASLTPAVIKQLTPSQAAEAKRLYGKFLTDEQLKAVNRRQ